MIAAWLILKNSGLQFAFLFGTGLIGGAILTVLSRLTNNIFRQFRWPNAGTYLFGWIGVPVHEFCHAFFCKLFLHEVENVKWFDPKAADGAHGSVTHGYQPWNLYHRIGHFFIGLGPVLLGPVILAGLFWLCVPSARGILPAFVSGGTHATLLSLKAVIGLATFKTIGFWIFVYLGFAIASQIELSSADLEQAAKGVIPVFGVLVLLNLSAWALGYRWHSRVVDVGHTVSATISGVYAFSAVVAVTTFAGCTLVFGFLNFVCGRGFINPFGPFASGGSSSDSGERSGAGSRTHRSRATRTPRSKEGASRLARDWASRPSTSGSSGRNGRRPTRDKR